jgi:hypothetical protein
MGRHTTGSGTPSSGGPGERFGVCASADDTNSASIKVNFLIFSLLRRGLAPFVLNGAVSLCHWIWRGLFMMLLRDFREPAQPFCSDRRSNYDRSRGAVSRFLADSSPRLAHSTAHRKIAGREACHSPRRISCGAPLRAEDIGVCCAFSSPVGLAWVVVGEHPLLSAGVLVPHA